MMTTITEFYINLDNIVESWKANEIDSNDFKNKVHSLLEQSIKDGLKIPDTFKNDDGKIIPISELYKIIPQDYDEDDNSWSYDEDSTDDEVQ